MEKFAKRSNSTRGPNDGNNNNAQPSGSSSDKQEIQTTTSDFSEQEKDLDNLRKTIAHLNNEMKQKEGHTISHDFGIDKIDKEGDPNGPMLAYVAQMIRSSIARPLWKGENGPEVVVAAALAKDNEHGYRFIVGVNVHKRFAYLVPGAVNSIPAQIAGIEVVLIFDCVYQNYDDIDYKWETRHRKTKSLQTALDNIKNRNHADPNKKGKVTRKDPLPNRTTLCSWHAEQKVLRFLKNDRLDARRSVTALGVAHVKGPCSFKTAGCGANHCADYLARKREKAINGGGSGAVAAFWYSGKAPNWAEDGLCSLQKLRDHKITVVMPGENGGDTKKRRSSSNSSSSSNNNNNNNNNNGDGDGNKKAKHE